MINQHRIYCYRITHIDNLPLLLHDGIVNKYHPNSSNNYINIGNPEVIDVRSTMPVRIHNYGMIGEYVPFYFTPKSIMLYIDWQCIQNSNFSKSDGDYDRPRRYQAGFLVHGQVPLASIESLNVHNDQSENIVAHVLNQNNINLAVNVRPQYFH
jgi:hypothetical protein